MRWKDHRLSFKHLLPPSFNVSNLTGDKLEFHGSMAKNVWSPDLYIRNSLAGKHMGVLTPSTLLHISVDGDILLSRRFVIVY